MKIPEISDQAANIADIATPASFPIDLVGTTPPIIFPQFGWRLWGVQVSGVGSYSTDRIFPPKKNCMKCFGFFPYFNLDI